MEGTEQKFITDAFNTNWIAPFGSNIDGFENDIKQYLGGDNFVTALNSGTAAIHLALQLLKISKGDEVICQSFTFSATINPVVYQGATPVFVDSERDSWNISPELLEKAIKDRIQKHKKPKAIIVVHNYGMPCNINAINAISKKYKIPVIEDAAAALGSSYFNKACSTLFDIGVLSFNGNKIITTSGGGALIVKNEKFKKQAIFFATQAKDNAVHYEHTTVGYNYRISNVLAGIGRGQMEVLEKRIASRRENFNFYKEKLSPYFNFQEEPQGAYSNRWITCIETESYHLREQIRIALLNDDIESRPLWKPMHLQPVFKTCLSFKNNVSETLFQKGLCLPSGSNLNENDLNRIIGIILKCLKTA